MAETFTLIRVIDTETTGLEDPAEMVEIGWTDVRLFPTGWQIESGPHSVLVRPGIPISFEAMAAHHLTEADVANGDDPDRVRAEVVKGADVLCAHNAAFDNRFIRCASVPWICTFKAAKTIWPEAQSHKNGALRYELGLCPGDERTQPAHRAGPDTWVTAHILLECLKTHDLEKLIRIARNPVRLLKINFGKHEGMRFSELPDDYLDWILNKSDMRSDPKKEDVVFTAGEELRRRNARALSGNAPQLAAPSAPAEDPDAWRATIGKEPF